MHLQRVGIDENPAERSLLNGPLRARSKERTVPSIPRREGIRELPGICWYPVKRADFPQSKVAPRVLFY